jgi:hypothetical protein
VIIITTSFFEGLKKNTKETLELLYIHCQTTTSRFFSPPHNKESSFLDSIRVKEKNNYKKTCVKVNITFIKIEYTTGLIIGHSTNVYKKTLRLQSSRN